ncbi:MAG: HU family DNA-binding protein [Clostridia bacterium]|nr:HU family DNA-binding protein [Clostridia bacterium]
MIKIDMARALGERMDITLKDGEEFLAVFMDVVGETLEKGEKIQLAGFGLFDVRHAPERKGRNPKTNEALIIPACCYPVFKAGKGLKDRVAKCQPTVGQAETDTKAIETQSSAPSPKPDRKKKGSSSVEKSV